MTPTISLFTYADGKNLRITQWHGNALGQHHLHPRTVSGNRWPYISCLGWVYQTGPVHTMGMEEGRPRKDEKGRHINWLELLVVWNCMIRVPFSGPGKVCGAMLRQHHSGSITEQTGWDAVADTLLLAWNILLWCQENHIIIYLGSAFGTRQRICSQGGESISGQSPVSETGSATHRSLCIERKCPC